jgi:heat shock protein HslJ
MIKIWTLIAATGVLCAGCVGVHGPGVPVGAEGAQPRKSAVAPQAPKLGGTNWKLISLNENAYEFLRDPRQPAVTLKITAELDEVSGYAGHNYFGALTEVNGDRVRFWRFYHTQRPGGESAENFERIYTYTLGRVVAWRINGQELSLYGNDGGRLAVFRALPADEVRYVEPWPVGAREWPQRQLARGVAAVDD